LVWVLARFWRKSRCATDWQSGVLWEIFRPSNEGNQEEQQHARIYKSAVAGSSCLLPAVIQ